MTCDGSLVTINLLFAIYDIGLAGLRSGQSSPGERVSPLRKYERWLGHWKPEYDAFTRETEVVLQVRLLLSCCIRK